MSHDAAFDHVADQVRAAKAEMTRVLLRQNRWRKNDLHRAIGGFDRCSGAVASLAVFEMIDEGVARWDDDFYVRRIPVR